MAGTTGAGEERKAEKEELPVVRINRRQLILLVLTFVLAWAGIYMILDRFTDSTVPLGDSFTTALAIVATWMLTRKIIEQWFLWIIANLVSIALYIYKGLYPTGHALCGLCRDVGVRISGMEKIHEQEDRQ